MKRLIGAVAAATFLAGVVLGARRAAEDEKAQKTIRVDNLADKMRDAAEEMSQDAEAESTEE